MSGGGNQIAGTTAVVTGASRGFGRAVAEALCKAGAEVIGIARDRTRLEEVQARVGGAFVPVGADATDPTVAGLLLEQHRPRTLVLNAGATPLPRPIHHHTWQTFTRNWDVDVQHVFHWIREALLLPLGPGSTIITMSSGAALRGSPISGGYAGAKATIRFITSYAAEESERAGLGLQFVSLLPGLTPATDLGAIGARGYARRAGVDLDTFLDGFGPSPTPEGVGDAVIELVGGGFTAGSYQVTDAGLAEAP